MPKTLLFYTPPSAKMLLAVTAASFAMIGTWSTAVAAAPPPIRLSQSNQVPACVTPDRLMAFLRTRNRKLYPQFRRIAEWYKYHGESWQVRWDYAFFQMAIETNFLTYRAPNGRWGDVDPKQNNFAGIGTTGGGVPGNSFPNVGTGVLAQIQHLVVYSGEFIPSPVAPRTRLKQDVILKLSRPVAARRPVTFQDLSGRWAVDKKYGRSIEYVAKLFRRKFCRGASARARRRPVTGRSVASASTLNRAQKLGLPEQAALCRVQVATFGAPGRWLGRTVLIHSQHEGGVQLTALDVEPSQADRMASKFIESHAKGGVAIAAFDDRQSAIGRAHAICKNLTRSG